MDLANLRQIDIDFFRSNAVPAMAIASPISLMLARGTRAADGRFDPADDGPVWFAIEEENDVIFWRPRTGEIAVDTGRAFALGQELIGNPGMTALGTWLNVYANPLQWLKASRNGIYVLPDRWPWAFEWLRDIERVAVAEELLSAYRKYMRPKMPTLAVLPRAERVAA